MAGGISIFCAIVKDLSILRYDLLIWNKVNPVLTLALGRMVLCMRKVGRDSIDCSQDDAQSRANKSRSSAGPTIKALPPRRNIRLNLATIVVMVVGESNESYGSH